MEAHSLFVETQQFIAPIGCSECGGDAGLIYGRRIRSRVWKSEPLSAQSAGIKWDKITPSEDHAP